MPRLRTLNFLAVFRKAACAADWHGKIFCLIISDVPRCRDGSQVDKAAIACAVHEPNHALAGDAVLPKNVRLAVAIEISRARDVP